MSSKFLDHHVFPESKVSFVFSLWGDWHFAKLYHFEPGSKCGFDRFKITELIKKSRDA